MAMRIFRTAKDLDRDSLYVNTTLKVPKFSDFPDKLGIDGQPGFEGNIIFNSGTNSSDWETETDVFAGVKLE